MMDIPILNRPYEPLSWYPTALVKCNCRLPQLVILIITGMQNLVCCPMCNNGYLITGVLPDGQLNIRVVKPQPMDESGEGKLM